MIKFTDEVVRTEGLNSIVDLTKDVTRNITLYAKPVTKSAVEEECSLKTESYSSTDFDHKNLMKKAELHSEKNQDEPSDDASLLEISDSSCFEREEEKKTEDSNVTDFLNKTIVGNETNAMSHLEIPDQIHRRSDKISDKHVIYPKEEFAVVISQSLQEIQQDISDILEEFEQESVTTPHPVSRLAEALENLRRTIIVVRSNVSQIALEVSSSDDKSEQSRAESCEGAERISLSLKELLQPILEVREALSQTQDHRAPEVLLLNRLDQPIRAIEFNVLQLALEAHSHTIESEETSSRASLDAMARALEDIESQIPFALDEVSSRQEVIGILRNILKPLEVIKERMHEIPLDTAVEDDLEIDLASILNLPVDKFRDALNDVYNRIESIEYHEEKNKDAISKLKYLIEPLVELQSSLSAVKNSRRTSIIEIGVLDERRNVILKAVEEVRLGIAKIRDETDTTREMSSLEKLITTSVDELDFAIDSVKNRIRYILIEVFLKI